MKIIIFLLMSFTGLSQCLPPTNFEVANIDYTSADLSWNSSPTAGSYKLTYRYIGGPLKTVITQDTTYHLSNLLPGTTYNCTLRSMCGTKIGSVVSNLLLLTFTTQSTPIPCVAPTALMAEQITSSSAYIRWQSNNNSFYLRYRPVNQGWITRLVDTTAIYLTGLEERSVYQWEVRAICGTDTSGAPQSSFITLESCQCKYPADISEIYYPTTIDIVWDAQDGAELYELRYGPYNDSQGYATTMDSVQTPLTHYALEGLTLDTVYEYNIRTICFNKQGNWSPPRYIVTYDLQGLVIYPNPTTGDLYVRATTRTEGMRSFIVYDDQGNVCYAAKAYLVEGMNEWTIPTTILSRGTYYVRISGKTIKFLKR